MLQSLFFVNGIYDILCAACILKIIDIPFLSELHTSMIKIKNPVSERFLAYWIFTYGIIRISGNRPLISYSYFIEAAFFANEFILDNVYTEKTIFVVASSLVLGVSSIEKLNFFSETGILTIK